MARSRDEEDTVAIRALRAWVSAALPSSDAGRAGILRPGTRAAAAEEQEDTRGPFPTPVV